ncbi:YigZ family protein [Snodgrassella sp. CFCC 13594]|uniref:IMPACT family protein n=1 Tax=Snodgrassella sp. CFCC 13594 TaxID=1775559 RepID=UPI000834DB77|nr:YigZ family protein [Snodgrassella sp. CFCC 13594]
MAVTQFTTLVQSTQAEFKDKGSRFLAFASPILLETDIKPLIQDLREAHHKARHCCFAWRLGVDGNRFRANDDGEPSGSAGRPILGQIDSAQLTDILVVVVRYFGGTLLGVPGLIHAYKTAAAAAIALGETAEKDIQKIVVLRCEYPHLSGALRIAKQFQATVIQQDLQLDCKLVIQVPLAQLDACWQAWQDTRVMRLSVENQH